MAEDGEPFPDWDKPATKGDLIGVMVATRACVVDIYVALSRLHRNDREGFGESIKDLDEADDRLDRLIDRLGGRVAADGE